MSDNIIKNSNRNTKKHERINYVPEYKKLGLNPNAPIARTNKRINERVEQTEEEKIGEIPPMPKLTIDIPTRLPLREYQAEGVAYGMEKLHFLMQSANSPASPASPSAAQTSWSPASLYSPLVRIANS